MALVQWTGHARADVTAIFLIFPRSDMLAAAALIIPSVFTADRGRRKEKSRLTLHFVYHESISFLRTPQLLPS